MPADSLDSLIISYHDFQRYNGHHALHTLELPRPSNDNSALLIDPKATPHDITQWLRQPGTNPNSSNATMKILLIQTHNQSTAKRPPSLLANPIPLSQQSPVFQTSQHQKQAEFVIDILTNLDLPLAAFGAYLKAHLTFVCVPPFSSHSPSDNGPRNTSTAYYCSGTSWTVTWSHNLTTNHTAAVMWYREGDGDQRKNEVLTDLLRLQTHLSHPMLLGYIKTKVSLSFTFDMLDDMNRETLALEQEIGFPTWNWVLDRVEPGRGVGETQDQAVEGFNILSGKLTNIRFRLKTFQQQIKFISRCNNQYRKSLDRSAPNFQSAWRECQELDHFMNVMWDYTFIHLFDADSLGERLHNAMAAVFQLTTQRDSRASLAVADINNELAWQGKNTNKAMRTIAFVSLLFLPGTFVASFFDTPIFNFAMPPNHNQIIVPLPFAIYWTVSIVLTLGLVMAWISYLRRSKEMDLLEREIERKQFHERIRRRQPGGPAAMLLEGRNVSETNKAFERRSTWEFLVRNRPRDGHNARDGARGQRVQETLYGIPLGHPHANPVVGIESMKPAYLNPRGREERGWPSAV
ncbi:uncharacterized protein Z520_02306 [Fonsecaea multimorphosa CBS 102226]|uniref:Uncharacterized protein n=1 Tax=Fonsecaea multimorphosa CBS 102226 TaxID=1442371 RepID=A0A0D2K7W5_9EURO|nr:uncharacterized protein Z520_02306 [Fonsecaea multimorphosa CBS 102226]KIY02168.1 hypothetical protein Z520_02306 [Fonsecaea multimorphosa CBS 102226]OAL29362.1 hypothetical protein AYO22_02256 [Fonsecaea multimorphosa]